MANQLTPQGKAFIQNVCKGTGNSLLSGKNPLAGSKNSSGVGGIILNIICLSFVFISSFIRSLNIHK